jgi:hypothetical protein
MKHASRPEIAARFARIALGHVTREYPHKLDHVLDGTEDVLPRASCTRSSSAASTGTAASTAGGLLLTLRRLFPDLPEAARIAALADEMLHADKVAGELAYLDRPLIRAASSGPMAGPGCWRCTSRRSGTRMPAGAMREPLARAFAERFRDYLDKLTYPIRTGTHFNTAFALILALEWARDVRSAAGRGIRDWSARWFGGDRDCQAWEPAATSSCPRRLWVLTKDRT